MTRRHNTRHFRRPGGYRRRLEKRGLKTTPVMEDLDTLTKRQNRRLAPWAEDGDRSSWTAADATAGGGE